MIAGAQFWRLPREQDLLRRTKARRLCRQNVRSSACHVRRREGEEKLDDIRKDYLSLLMPFREICACLWKTKRREVYPFRTRDREVWIPSENVLPQTFVTENERITCRKNQKKVHKKSHTRMTMIRSSSSCCTFLLPFPLNPSCVHKHTVNESTVYM